MKQKIIIIIIRGKMHWKKTPKIYLKGKKENGRLKTSNKKRVKVNKVEKNTKIASNKKKWGKKIKCWFTKSNIYRQTWLGRCTKFREGNYAKIKKETILPRIWGKLGFALHEMKYLLYYAICAGAFSPHEHIGIYIDVP